MKKITIIALFLASLGHAQQGYLSVGADIRNATFGSDATNDNPKLNLNFKAAAIGNEGIEGGIGYELFKRIQYDRMYIFGGYQVEVLEDFKAVPALEFSLINRWGTWGGGLKNNSASSHLTIGLSVPIRYSFSDSFAIELQTNVLLRTDTKAKYGAENWDGFKIAGVPTVISNYLNFIIKL